MSHAFVPPQPDPSRRWPEWCQHPVPGGVCNQEEDHAVHWRRAHIERAGRFLVCAYPVLKIGSAWRSFLRRDRARSAVDAGQVVTTVREPTADRPDDERRRVWVGYGGVGDPPPAHTFACSSRTASGKFDCEGRVKDCPCAECGAFPGGHG